MKMKVILLSVVILGLSFTGALAQSGRKVIHSFDLSMTPHSHQPFLADEVRIEVERGKQGKTQNLFLVQEIREKGRTSAGCIPPDELKADYSSYGPCSFEELHAVLTELAKRGKASDQKFTVTYIGEDETLRENFVSVPLDVQERFLMKIKEESWKASYNFVKRALTITMKLNASEVIEEDGNVSSVLEVPVVFALPFSGVGMGVADLEIVDEAHGVGKMVQVDLLQPWQETIEYEQRP